MKIKTALLTAACALALSACGDRSAPPADSTATQPATPATEPATVPADTVPATTPTEPVQGTPGDTTPAPAAGTGEPVASGCTLEMESNDAMQYNVKAITVPASCAEFTITMHHVGKMPVAAMGHNVVITTPGDMAGVVADGMAAGLDAGFLKADDARIIAHTDMIGGGQTTSVTFPVSKLQGGEDYKFFCSFPGHAALMNGTIRVE